MELQNAEDMFILSLKNRQKQSLIDEQELITKIEEYAKNGETFIYLVRNENEEYPTLSIDFLQELKENGYTIDWTYKNGWDKAKRFYKGPIKINWGTKKNFILF